MYLQGGTVFPLFLSYALIVAASCLIMMNGLCRFGEAFSSRGDVTEETVRPELAIGREVFGG
jgi:hypothetical protein